MFAKKCITPRLKFEMLEADLTLNGSEFHMSTVKVALLLYLESNERVFSEILPDRCFSPFYPNFYEYEMLIEREVRLFSVLFLFLNNCQQPASD